MIKISKPDGHGARSCHGCAENYSAAEITTSTGESQSFSQRLCLNCLIEMADALSNFLLLDEED